MNRPDALKAALATVRAMRPRRHPPAAVAVGDLSPGEREILRRAMAILARLLSPLPAAPTPPPAAVKPRRPKPRRRR